MEKTRSGRTVKPSPKKRMIDEDSKKVSKPEVKKANKPEEKKKPNVDKNDKPLKKTERVRIHLVSKEFSKFCADLNYCAFSEQERKFFSKS